MKRVNCLYQSRHDNEPANQNDYVGRGNGYSAHREQSQNQQCDTNLYAPSSFVSKLRTTVLGHETEMPIEIDVSLDAHVISSKRRYGNEATSTGPERSLWEFGSNPCYGRRSDNDNSSRE